MTIGPLSLDDYMGRWGNRGESAMLEVVVHNVLFDKLSESQLKSIRNVFVEHFAQAAGVEPSGVQDTDGNDVSISLDGEGNAPSRGLMGNCAIKLPFGQVVSDIAQELRKKHTRYIIAKDLSKVKGIKIRGGTLHADDIEIEVEKTGQDIFSQSDQDISGMLDASEFKMASDSYMSQPLTQEQSDLVFSALDANRDLQLSDREFFAVSRVQAAPKPTLQST